MKIFSFFALYLLLSACSSKTTPSSTGLTAPSLAFEEEGELNPYGVIFTHQHIGEEISEDGVSKGYQLTASNLPIGQHFFLIIRNLKKEIQSVEEFAVNAEGDLVSTDPNNPFLLKNLKLFLGRFCAGEPLEYLLTSNDGLTRVSTRIVPYPIEASSQDGAKVTLSFIDPSALSFYCKGEGFEPFEKIELITLSDGEQRTETRYASKEGNLYVLLHPRNQGKKGGQSSLLVVRQNGVLNLEYKWGSEALTTLHGKKV